jgi:hypothetical protein
MIVPTTGFLSEVENLFLVFYPKTYKDFCDMYRNQNIIDDYPKIINGSFINDLGTLKMINSRIGNEQWKDYELAIAGKSYPKEGTKLWGEILPFYYDKDKVIYGFNYKNSTDDKIYAWSVHCVVHVYSDFNSWLVCYSN